MADVISPTVHMNGSGRDSLMAGYQEADRALVSAMSALQATYPNGRDYYLRGPDAIQTAMREHQARVDRLQAVRVEINAILEVLEG